MVLQPSGNKVPDQPGLLHRALLLHGDDSRIIVAMTCLSIDLTLASGPNETAVRASTISSPRFEYSCSSVVNRLQELQKKFIKQTEELLSLRLIDLRDFDLSTGTRPAELIEPTLSPVV